MNMKRIIPSLLCLLMATLAADFVSQLKEEFSARKLKEKSEGGDQNEPPTLSAEEMSQFYKKFLDDNYKAHVQFNKYVFQCWTENFCLSY